MTAQELQGQIDRVADARALKKIVAEQVSTLEKTSGELQTTLADLESLQVYVQTIAKEMQEELRFTLEGIVNTALDAVFPGMYTFRVTLKVARNKTEVSLGIVGSDYPDVEMDPVSSNGGGLTDILAFTLRMAVLLISKKRRILLLDEAMKFVSNDLKPDAFAILKRLSGDFGIQVIGVTHDAEMIQIADRVFSFKKVGNYTGVSVKGV